MTLAFFLIARMASANCIVRKKILQKVNSLDYIYINNLKDYETELAALATYCNRIALDTETYTKNKYRNYLYAENKLRTNPHTGAVSLLSICTEHGTDLKLHVLDIICLEAQGCDFSQLQNLLTRADYLVGHNLKFDLAMLLPIVGSLERTVCTYTLANLYANATGSKLWQVRGMDLGSCCRDWLGVNLTGKGTIQASEWYSDPISRNLDNPSWRVKLDYAASDVKYLFPLCDRLTELLKADLPEPLNESAADRHGFGMAGALLLETKLTPIVAAMEVAGLPFDLRIATAFSEAIEIELQQVTIKLCQNLALPLTIDGLWGEPIPDPSAFKILNNPKALVKMIETNCGVELPKAQNALFDRLCELLTLLNSNDEIEVLDTEIDIYKQLENLNAEAISLGLTVFADIVRYKKLLKQKSLALSSFVNVESNRVHPNYQPLRAATGRFSCTSPNVQQVSARLDIPVKISYETLSSLVDIKFEVSATPL
jgi:DNA polymerase I-like protein with 3'-5' exonuclease and polymerase domains